jgi:eukaryotic-like serine/threonine-protein kinase
MLWELLTGVPPRRAESLAELGRPGTFRASDLRANGVPDALALVVTECLAEDPERRPQSAAAVARRLTPFTSDAQTLALPVDPSRRATEILAPAAQRGGRPLLRRLGVGAALAAAAAIGLAVALLATGGGTRAKTRTGPPARVAPPGLGANPTQEAQNLARWLLDHSRKVHVKP